MAVWRDVEASRHDIDIFVDKTDGFHDFRIASITCSSRNRTAEVFLEYFDKGVLLRFEGVSEIIHYPEPDYEANWIYYADTRLIDNKCFQWAVDEDYTGEPTTSIKAERIRWAITDAGGQPIDVSDV